MLDPFSRREFLRISGLSAVLAALSACKPFGPGPTTATAVRSGNSPSPTAIPIPDEQDLLLHTLRRTTFGPTAAELAEAQRLGLSGWIEAQLNPASLDQTDVDQRLSRLSTLDLSPADLIRLDDNGLVARELGAAALTREIFSPAQLYEGMVDFWTNHFNIYAYSPPVLFLKGQDDREVIRAHALGKFPEMLRASAHSPAMLVYLDNASSQQPSPNENYARELLELHSLGVDGGYTHSDIEAVARAFTGWTVGTFRRLGDRPGEFVYRAAWHDEGPKAALGQALPGGKGDGDRVLDLLAEHPSTARFIATKLCRRFVADAPPASLTERVAATYLQTDGDIPAMLRTILYSDEFAESAGLKLKRPLDFAVSAIRVTGADGRLERVLRSSLEALGQLPYAWPGPDGYPDYAEAWTSTSQTLNRWNLAIGLTSGQIPGITTQLSAISVASGGLPTLIDELSDFLLGTPLPESARSILIQFGESLPSGAMSGGMELSNLMAGLVLCTADFQIH
jgi:uncharacterized protein (DUF1800 family)